MNIPRRIFLALVIAVVATVAAVRYYPSTDFVQHAVTLIAAGTVSTLLLAAAAFYREKSLTMHDKTVLMNAFLIAILVPSLYAAGAFMHESQTSWSGGEIHYHADFEVLVGNGEVQELDLVDPGEFCDSTAHESSFMCRLNDRTGSKEYHEHNDDRVHLEGTFKTMEDASLASFFERFGGELTNERLVFPTNNGVREFTEDGDKHLKILVHRGVAGNRAWCAIDEDASSGDLCINQYTGEKAASPSDYVVSPYSRGPNLDDIFIIHDSKSLEEALADVRADDNYMGRGLTKEGTGYGG